MILLIRKTIYAYAITTLQRKNDNVNGRSFSKQYDGPLFFNLNPTLLYTPQALPIHNHPNHNLH